MNRDFLNDLQNWLKWYNYHRSMVESMPLERKVEFLTKANYGAVKLIAGLTDELIALERGGNVQRHVILPPWVRT